ncbi:uncharacterized protein LOC111711431 [Eurytemora carolleeae]|uniref:uncharacterized protein LOC111711431 n=1 Tax=Eurytemora carolleeae TaxID=1294199 RepID=UPI000C76F931|nr:uncharacterized protein LOC111711431 [Eurytemora carolleeae]|eukprot:XP_023341564.1 uncharacterized protein LOC111711431 [Eurytemora affinis]
MVPDYLQILNLSTDPAQLVHLYRFKGNDPINDIKTNYYHTLDSWLKYFKFDLELLKSPLIDPDRSKGYKTKMIELPRYLQVGKPPQSKNTDFLDPALQKMFTLQCDQRRPELGNFYHVKSPLLGPNILIKRTEHKLLTQTLPGASTVETLIAQGAGSQQICLLDGLESADYVESILSEDDI